MVGVFTAHFSDYRPGHRTIGKGPDNVHAHIITAGEGNTVNLGAVDDRLADRPAAAGNEIEHTGRHARVTEARGEQPARIGGVGGRLEDDGIAGDHCAARWSAGQGAGGS